MNQNDLNAFLYELALRPQMHAATPEVAHGIAVMAVSQVVIANRGCPITDAFLEANRMCQVLLEARGAPSIAAALLCGDDSLPQRDRFKLFGNNLHRLLEYVQANLKC